MSMTEKIGAAALVAAAIGFGGCGVSVVGGHGETIAGGGAGATTAGEHSAAELGCVSGALEPLVPERCPAGHLATDAQYLYWADLSFASQADYEQQQFSHELVRTSKVDGSTAVIESGLGGVSGVFLDGDDLYFAVFIGGGGTPSSHEIRVIPKDGSGPAVPLYTADWSFTFTAADPDQIFLLQTRPQPGAALISVNKADGTTTTLAPQATMSASGDLTEDATHLYWWDDGGMRIASLAKGVGAPQTFAAVSPSDGWVQRVITDAENVYWVVTTPDAHATFYRAPKAGGSPVVLAQVGLSSQYASTSGMAVDDHCLYWTEFTSESNPATGANIGKVHALRKSDGLLALPARAEPAAGAVIADDSGLYLAAPAATMSPPDSPNPPGLMGAVQRVAR